MGRKNRVGDKFRLGSSLLKADDTVEAWLIRCIFQWLCADPITIPDLSAYICSPTQLCSISPTMPDLTASQRYIPNAIEGISQKPIGLSTLPPGFLSAILTRLPLLSVPVLERTCKDLYERVSAQLTSHFWRARAKRVGDLLGWPLPEELDGIATEADINWKEVLKSIKRGPDTIAIGKESEDIDVGCSPIGRRNRWGIWKVLESIGADGEERL